ncbi:ribonuclease R [Candidatus Ornithobacterium hominis]|uniref:ribonuclease R n=1 Tax=Candidatus Ornithobacterium hominis TaxID=2497989 RepID=UPI0024BC48C8|nr:ribonuclease R [Candidatus Ornithobacterium hominis]CAI9429068.1 ribonuclease R [Candidatus Ornithobacterium hominis]
MSKKKKVIPHQKKGDGYQKIAKKILQYYLKYPNKTLNHKQLSSALQYTNAREKQHLIKVLSRLAADDTLIEETPGKFKLNMEKNTLVGTIDFTSSGAAYVVVEGLEDDVYIPKGQTKNALQNDLVQLLLRPTSRGKKQEGSILKVLQRNRMQYVGILEIIGNRKYGFVNLEQNSSMHVDIYISKENLNHAKNGEKVVAEIVSWPEDTDSPFGTIIRSLGKPGEHDVEMHAILAEYGLPYHFPDEVEAEAQAIDTRILPEEIQKRRDMRSVPTFTIDPADAKDFDDALSFQVLENGNYEIGVHIADVSHYVKPGSLLDEEAYNRATSVYLVDRVVPMLPEILSNGVCSLRPYEEKYTFSAVFEMDEDANILKHWYGRTVTYSDRRFSYEEAQKIIEGETGDFQKEILKLNQLAKTLREQRLKNGAISFDSLEVKFHLDEEGNPTGIYFKQMKDSNHLIEEFMLLANRKVSEFVSTNKKGKPNEKTFIYRIHDDPDPEKLASLKQFISQFGYDLKLGERKETTSSINQLLKEVQGKGEENMIETLAMRSMSKAVYSTENIGHYGLAFQYYSHFTSPIRRYPDIIAHRLLQHYLDGGESPKAETYEEKCEHCSQRERLAADAERDSTKYMQVKYMNEHIGEEYYGVISGVTEWGIYVELPESLAEGLVRLRNIHDDHYVFDPKSYAIIGQKSKKTYQLGDQVRIKVLRADLEKKQLDFELLG